MSLRRDRLKATGAGQAPPGLCLLDAWVGMSDAYLERLTALNQITEPWVSVLVPWNSQDEDRSQAEGILRDRLRQHLADKLASVPRRCRMAANGIPTMRDFSELLPEMTMTC